MHCMADIIQSPPQTEALDTLGEIERQVLWLSTAIIDHANRVRPNPGGIKVGGTRRRPRRWSRS